MKPLPSFATFYQGTIRFTADERLGLTAGFLVCAFGWSSMQAENQ